MRRLIAALTFLCLFPLGAAAENEQVEPVWQVMRLDEFLSLLSQEGLREARELENLLFPGNGGQGWKDDITKIYDPEQMALRFRAELSDQLDRRDVRPAIEFFASDLGARAIDLELSARQAILDPDIEDASHEVLFDMRRENDPRLSLIAEFSDANDLVEQNVVGTMNGNYAFLSTLAGEGQGPYADDPSEILGGVWAQEDEIRAETLDWLLSYFLLAYQPFSDDQIRDLIAFSQTPASRRLNTAQFATFDQVFADIERELAQSVAGFMNGERL